MGEKSLIVCTPSLTSQYDKAYVSTIIDLQSACAARGYKFSWGTITGTSVLPIARNRCVEKFIESSATHMLFLDDDVGVFASDVITLMDLDVEFSAIPYNKREAEFSGAISAVQGITLRTNPSVLASLLSVPTFVLDQNQENIPEIYKQNGMARAKRVGTGAMLLKKSVFTKIAKSNKIKKIVESAGNDRSTEMFVDSNDESFKLEMHEFFSYGQEESGTFLSEDYKFCDIWKELGYEIWIKMNAKSTHVGRMGYEFDIEELNKMMEDRLSSQNKIWWQQRGGKEKYGNDKIAIIVPYRKREEHLRKFIESIKDYPMPDKKIYIIEQLDEKPFNRGKLCNIGFLEAKDFTHVVFHDVDMIPENVDYTTSYGVTHLATAATQFNEKRPYPEYIGGVTMFDRESFKRINGFSNSYWGWGLEDDDLFRRCVQSGVSITSRFGGRHISLPHDLASGHSQDGVQTYRKGTSDGLSDCSYEIVSKKEDDDGIVWVGVLV